MSDKEFILQIQRDFLNEAAELLLNVEQLSLTLSKNLQSDEVFAELARLAHNFKGTGKAVGFDNLSLLAHRIEDLIISLKSMPDRRSQESVDLLFQCLDVLKAYVSALSEDPDAILEIGPTISSIDGFLNSTEMNVQKFIETTGTSGSSGPALLAAKETSKNRNHGATESFRVPKPKLDFLLDSFGEQIILQSTLDQLKFQFDEKKDEIIKIINLLSKQTIELQKQVLSLTMIPLGPLFTKLDRAARDAARACGKDIEIEFHGGELEADKILIDSISDSLVHMIRNSVDHGIENRDTRVSLGKDFKGKIIVEARRVGAQLWFDIIDDGGGLDPDKIKLKALEKDLLAIEKFNQMDDRAAFNLIFENGFSTKEEVSEVSGRGVGMNVVKESVEALKGEIVIDSKIGKGTCFRLKLPLSLAIFNGAIIRVHDTRYVVPTTDIAEITYPGKELKIYHEDRKSYVRCRDEVFELVDLREYFGPNRKNLSGSPYFILTRKGHKLCYAVDEIMGVQRIVQKNLSDELKSRAGFVAGTILGDGSPGIVLNLSALRRVA